MTLADYHMHLVDDDYVGESLYTLPRIEQYVLVADRRGLVEIGITDHCYRFVEFEELFRPIYDGPRRQDAEVAWLQDNLSEPLERYVEAIVLAQQRGWPVKLGLEVDWFTHGNAEGAEEQIRAILEPYPWDYILGSVHFLDDWPVDVAADYGWPERDVEATYAQYFAALEDAARSGLYDVLAHPDLIKKFGHRIDDPTAHYKSIVTAAAENGVALEVSTAGRHYPAGELYPAPAFLEEAAQQGVPVTFASDAHAPERVGRDFPHALAAARDAGCPMTVLFSRRQKRIVPLDEISLPSSTSDWPS